MFSPFSFHVVIIITLMNVEFPSLTIESYSRLVSFDLKTRSTASLSLTCNRVCVIHCYHNRILSNSSKNKRCRLSNYVCTWILGIDRPQPTKCSQAVGVKHVKRHSEWWQWLLNKILQVENMGFKLVEQVNVYKLFKHCQTPMPTPTLELGLSLYDVQRSYCVTT